MSLVAAMSADLANDLLRRGREALAAADWEGARSCFEQALLELGETVEVLDGLSQALHFQGRHLEAIECKERAFAAYATFQVGDQTIEARAGGAPPSDEEMQRMQAAIQAHGCAML